MARHNPEPWFRTERNGYFVTINGVQHNLHTADKAEAFRRWHELMARAPKPPESPQATVVVLMAQFLEWVEKHKKPSTYAWRSNYLQSLVTYLNGSASGLRVADFKPFHVTRWLDSQTTWGVSSRCAAIATVKRVFNWAVEEGYIDHSPIASLRKPRCPRRETILTDEQRELIVKEASDEYFRDFVTLIQETGVRPQEVRSVEARHVDFQNSRWVFPPSEHKTGEKTGLPRIVYLNARALEITRRLAEQHPTGPLCRNSRGESWTRNAVRLRFGRLRKRLKHDLPENLCAYLFRHTFATGALERGLDAITVAELMGHKDVSMLCEVYQHLRQRTQHMRNAAERATSQNALPPTRTSPNDSSA